jgi:GNAT superfamily N-acetyltransferase
MSVEYFDADAVMTHERLFADLYRSVFSEPPYDEGEAEVADFLVRLKSHVACPGFAMTGVFVDGALVGCTYGFTMELDAPLWSELLHCPVAGRSADELLRPSAYIAEMMVASKFRRRGIAKKLHDAFINGRTEAQAVLFAHPDAHPAQSAYAKWGWEKVAAGEPFPGAGCYDTLLLGPLRDEAAG